MARGQGRAASTASNGGAGTVLVPGTRTQCMEEQRRSGERRRVQYILYRVTQVNHGRGKFGKGNDKARPSYDLSSSLHRARLPPCIEIVQCDTVAIWGGALLTKDCQARYM